LKEQPAESREMFRPETEEPRTVAGTEEREQNAEPSPAAAVTSSAERSAHGGCPFKKTLPPPQREKGHA